MSTSAFQAGAIVEIDRVIHHILRKVDPNTWQLEESRTKRIIERTDRDLHESYLEGQLRFVTQSGIAPEISKNKPPIDYSTDEWNKAKIRRCYVKAVLESPSSRPCIIQAIRETWDKLRQPERPPNPATVLRWKAKYLRAGQDASALIDQNHRKGNTQARYGTEVQVIVENAIDSIYLTQERKTLADVVDRVKAVIRKENSLRPESMQLLTPTRRLVKRMIDAIPAFDRYAARYGSTAAVKKFRAVLRNRITSAPLERAEMDHNLLDMLVIDDVTCLPLGRPWLTACIDDNTRTILGVFVSFEPPSYFTVARCVKQAILPKTWLQRDYPSIKNAWDAHGVMRELVVDNGSEFHSESLENACLSLGIEIHYAARKTPWFKGKIERFFGTLNGALTHGTPGTTFRNVIDKEEYDPSKHAVVRYSVLREMVYKWIVDVYHQRPHRVLGVPPAIMWSSSIAPEDILVPDDPARLNAILGRSETRTLTHKGIELDKLFYNSPELTALRRKLGDAIEVEVRVDAADIGKIVVFSPDCREMFTVPALRHDYAKGLSAWQHRICKRYAKDVLSKLTTDGWIEAKAEIADMIDREFLHKRRKTRSRMARYKGDTGLLGQSQKAASPLTAGPNTAREEPRDAALMLPPPEEGPAVPIAGTGVITPRKKFKPIFRERLRNEAGGVEE